MKKLLLVVGGLVVLGAVGWGVTFFLNPIVIWGVWPWSPIKINRSMATKMVRIGGRETGVFRPILMNVEYKIPTNEDFIVWQVADPKIASSVAFGCRWESANPNRLDLFVDVEKYLSYVDKEAASTRLNRGMGLCLVWNDLAAESGEEVVRLSKSVAEQLESGELIHLK